MKEEAVLFGTYDEIRNWYNNLHCISKDDFMKLGGLYSKIEFKPFNEQLENDAINIGSVKIICWLDPIINLNKEIIFTLKTKKICMVTEGLL